MTVRRSLRGPLYYQEHQQTLSGIRHAAMYTLDEKQGSETASGLVVIGPDGLPLTRDDLPPASTKRWVIRRKAEVVAGVRTGLISLTEACEMYALSIDEFLLWQHQLDTHGLEGLKVTRIADYRQPARQEIPSQRHSPE